LRRADDDAAELRRAFRVGLDTIVAGIAARSGVLKER
jgi:hypothetical protein